MASRTPKAKPTVNTHTPATSRHVRWFIPGLIFVLTMLVFLPTLQNGFINFDDPDNLLNNPHYKGLGWSNLSWMFTAFHLGHYHPLTWLTFAFDYLVWGMNPTGYHLTSLVLHAVNAVFFYYLTLHLLKVAITQPATETGLHIASAFSALIFSLHPLRVESVAWATERRDVLSGLFILLTLLCYLKAHDSARETSRSRVWLRLSVTFFALSLLSKAIGMSLPIVLIVLDVFPLRLLGGGPGKWFGAKVRRVWWEKIPFVGLAVVSAAIAVAAQRAWGALVTMEALGPVERMLQSVFGVVFYMVKTLVPTGLAPIYEMLPGTDFYQWRFIGSGIIFVVLSLGFFLARHRWPAGLASWICYLALIAPVLGIAQSGPQLVADRYSYLSCMPWAILVSSTLPISFRQRNNVRFGTMLPGMATAVGVVIIFALSCMTWLQNKVWRDSLTLWRYTTSVTLSGIAHHNLGHALEFEGQLDEALIQLRRAAELNPEFSATYQVLGRILTTRGDLEEAGQHLRRAMELGLKSAAVYRDMATWLAKVGKSDEAIAMFQHALSLDAYDVNALNNLGILLARRGSLDEAVPLFQRAIELRSQDASIHQNLAYAYLGKGDANGAINYFRRAVELNPNDAESCNSLAMILIQSGQLREAIRYLRRVLELKPQDFSAHHNLAISLANQGEYGEARQLFEKALEIDPNSAQTHAALARVLGAQGRTNEAMVHYQKSQQLVKSQNENLTKK
jgi:protein O-mannosyl-transferase